jgi:predicted amidohydrolase YtcJ
MTSTQPPQTGDVIYTARLIRTANPSHPTAAAIAIRDGKVLSVGTLEDCQQWGITNIDRQFEDKVLTAGFVEAHSHVMSGMYAAIPFVGWFGRFMPDGTWVEGVKSTDELVLRIREIAETTDAGLPIVVAGFDPIYLDTERLSRHHLDEATTQHPVFVFHASGHLGTVNSYVLNKYDIGPNHPAPGVGYDDARQPNGELREPAAMALARDEFRYIGQVVFAPETLSHFGNAMRNAGITTATDLGNAFHNNDEVLTTVLETTEKDSFPVRLASVPRILGGPDGMTEMLRKVLAARAKTHNKMHIPVVKMVLDGSIQGFTAVIDWPGYITGEDHGLFLFPPEQVVDFLRPFHEAGIGIHCHCNGSTTSGVFIDAIEQLLREHAWLDHRHTITHAQLITHAQMRKAKNLGMSANFFVNHVWFWGEQHRDFTVGIDRASAMNPCATADRIGLHYSFHTDSPVTPIGHLHTMWAAVNRITPHGSILGPNERIDIDRAFHAVTIDAAYQLHMDDVVGSLEVGKFADMTVLDADPYEVDVTAIRDINVWGTIVGGVPNQSTAIR